MCHCFDTNRKDSKTNILPIHLPISHTCIKIFSEFSEKKYSCQVQNLFHWRLSNLFEHSSCPSDYIWESTLYWEIWFILLVIFIINEFIWSVQNPRNGPLPKSHGPYGTHGFSLRCSVGWWYFNPNLVFRFWSLPSYTIKFLEIVKFLFSVSFALIANPSKIQGHSL